MVIHETARAHLEKVLQPGQYLKVSVVAGGCNGYSYKFDAVDSPDGCEVIERVAIEKRSMLFLKNAILVYRSTPFSGILSVENSDVKGTCGCGSSFDI